MCGKSLPAIARQAEDDEHDTAPAYWSVVPAGSGSDCIRHVGFAAAATLTAAGLALAAATQASTDAASAPAAAARAGHHDLVRLIPSIHPRLMSGYLPEN